MSDGDDFNMQERRGWELAGERYGFFRDATQFVTEKLTRVGCPPADGLGLDVGSGWGDVAAACEARGARMVAVDLAATMCRAAKSRRPESLQVRADGTALPFRARSFDRALAAFYLNHLSDPQAGLKELCRVVRPEGRVALALWDAPEKARHTAVVVEAVRRSGGDLTLGPRPRSAIPTTPEGLRRFADEAGLTDVGVEAVAGTLRVQDAEALLTGLEMSTVTTAGLIQRQSPAVRQRMLGELVGLTEPYRDDRGLALPMAAVVLHGSPSNPA